MKDLDLLYLDEYDPEAIVKSIRLILLNIKSDINFDGESIKEKKIWQDSISPGVRLVIPFEIGDRISQLQIDIATNDPLVESPVEQRVALLNSGFLKIRTVVVEIAAAWKLHGLFEHLNGPWQSKTLWDLYVLCRNNTLNPRIFRKAIKVAFSSRLDPLDIVKRLLYGDFGRSRKSAKRMAARFRRI